MLRYRKIDGRKTHFKKPLLRRHQQVQPEIQPEIEVSLLYQILKFFQKHIYIIRMAIYLIRMIIYMRKVSYIIRC